MLNNHVRLEPPAQAVGLPTLFDLGEKRQSILVVDDDPVLRRVLARLLRGRGHQVLTASSASQALIQLTDARPIPDVMITDVEMPGFNGIQLANQVARCWPSVQCILISARADEYVQTVRDAGIDGVLLGKPFKWAELEMAMNSKSVSFARATI